jgi:hypothetical protein
VPRKSNKKYRICTDSIAKTAGTTKRSTWSLAAKSRYDRCLKKVGKKQTNEGVISAKLAWEKTLRKRRTRPQHGTGGTGELTGQTAANPVVGGKRMQVSHTVYDRIGDLIKETIGASFAKGFMGEPTDPKKPGRKKEPKAPGALARAVRSTLTGENPYTAGTQSTKFKHTPTETTT